MQTTMSLRSVRPGAPLVRIAGAKPRSAQASRLVVRMSVPTKEDIEKAIKEAEQACEGNEAGDCAVAWDTVEELSAAASHAKAREADKPTFNDPMEKFCEGNPDADECRVYED